MKRMFSYINRFVSNRIVVYSIYFIEIATIVISLLFGVNKLLFLTLFVSLLYIIFASERVLLVFILMPLSLFTNLNIGSFSINVFHVCMIAYILVLTIQLIKRLKKDGMWFKNYIIYIIPTIYGIFVMGINILVGSAKTPSVFLENLILFFRDSMYLVFPFFILIHYFNKGANTKSLKFDYKLFFLITFTISSIFSFVIFKINPLLLYNDESEVLKISTKRFNGFDFDPNFFSLYGVFFNFHFLRTRPEKNIKYILRLIFTIVLNVLSLLSGSKMFIVCLLLFLISLAFKLYNYSKSFFMISYIVVCIVALSSMLFFGGRVIDFVNNRIINNGAKSYGGGFISSLTTGRTIIFADYSDYIMQNPLVFVFGLNFGNKTIDLHAVHNTFAYTIFNYGLPMGIFQLFSLYRCFFLKVLPRQKIDKIASFIAFIICLNSLNFYFTLNAISLFAILSVIDCEFDDQNDWKPLKLTRERKPKNEKYLEISL